MPPLLRPWSSAGRLNGLDRTNVRFGRPIHDTTHVVGGASGFCERKPVSPESSKADGATRTALRAEPPRHHHFSDGGKSDNSNQTVAPYGSRGLRGSRNGRNGGSGDLRFSLPAADVISRTSYSCLDKRGNPMKPAGVQVDAPERSGTAHGSRARVTSNKGGGGSLPSKAAKTTNAHGGSRLARKIYNVLDYLSSGGLRRSRSTSAR